MTLFGTSGVRGRVGESITAGLVLDIGRAVASGDVDRLVLGRDARDSGRWLADVAAAGACECGTDVIDLGVVATPTLAREVVSRNADAGIMVTASHNPPEYNGIKLWTETGRAYGSRRQKAVSDRVGIEDFEFCSSEDVGTRRFVDDAAGRHVDAMVEATDPLDDISVVVDAGNGTGGITATALERLGADVELINGEPDGEFPNRPSEPTPENCAELSEIVRDGDADLGIAHDGDADRMMATSADGTFISGDSLMGLFGRYTATTGDRIAAPVNTSRAVDEELESVGATVTRTPVGDAHVAEQTVNEDVVFGAEPSGVWIWPDETLCPDGPLAACRLTSIVDRHGPLEDLAAEVASYPIRRHNVEVNDKQEVMVGVRGMIRSEYESDQYTTVDGVHVTVDDGWFLIRASGTEPLVRVTAEAPTPERADEIVDRATDVVETAREADLPELKADGG